MIMTECSNQRVSIAVFGEFTLADYKEFEDLANYTIRFQGPVDLLFDLRDMTGATLDVAVEEFRFARQHVHDFRRIAVVTDSQWLTWSAWLSQMYVEADIQVFSDVEAAQTWLSQMAEEVAGS